jgi:carbon-monoxide dehydrogenase large subunit
MAFDVLPGLGEPLRRLEDPRLLTGQGRFAADAQPEGCLQAVFLRSPHAHARITGIEAPRMPGVTVLTGTDVAALGHNPAVTEIFDADGKRHIEPRRPVMARDRVVHVGEIVAMVVAPSLAAARDAADAIMMDYEPLPAVVDGQAALEPAAPLVHAEAPGNLCCDWARGDAAAVARALADAAHVTRLRLRSPRIVAGYLEPRAALAEWRDGQVVLTTPSQGVHILHRILCDHILGWPRARLRVVTEEVGGGFGPKLPPYPEQAFVCFAADRLRAPVRWVGDRTEHHLADTQARDLDAEIALALDAEGRIAAVGIEAVANLGAYVSTVAPTIPTGGLAKVISGLYAIPAIHVRMRLAFSHTTPVDAVRGAGKPEALVLLEAALDQAARETGRDPAALRRLNLVPSEAFPYRTALGFTYDSGDYPALLDGALEAADEQGFAARRAESEARGMRRGRGIACHLHGSGGWGDETSLIEVTHDGITARTGTQSQGQGHATAYAQIVAAAFGVTPAQVRIVQGDSATIPRGGGTGGSSSTIVSGTTLLRAAENAIENGRAAAADLLEASRDDVEWQGSHYAVAGTDRRIGLFEVAAKTPIAGQADFDSSVATWPAGVAIAEVEVDPETGAVRLERFVATVDVGRVVNPMLMEGQLHGGFAAGIGQALLEAIRHDEAGQILTATLMDYAMPRAADMPRFETLSLPCPTPNNPLGIKGMGELPTNGAPAAVANAVADAIGRPLELPLTPERVWSALR